MNGKLLDNLGKKDLQDILQDALRDVYENVPKWPSLQMAHDMSILDKGFGMCEIDNMVLVYFQGKQKITIWLTSNKKETLDMEIYYNKQSHQFIAVQGKIAISSYVANEQELPVAGQTGLAKELALGENGSVCVLLDFPKEETNVDPEKTPVPGQAPDYELGEKVEKPRD